jgi:hypothetical protein
MPGMTSTPKILLRYFDARGRAQFLRYYFRVRRIPFEDERVPLVPPDFTQWRSIRDDTSVSGPFRKLPVLHFDDEVVAEALVIAAFVHEQLGDSSRLSARDESRHAMLLSSLYSDSMSLLGQLLWAPRMYPGVDIKAASAMILERLRRHFESLDSTLAAWRWLDGLAAREVMLADCLLWDQLKTVGDVFGAHFDRGAFATLERFFEECPGRSEFAALLESHPCQITGTPDERAAIEKIQRLLDVAA